MNFTYNELEEIARWWYQKHGVHPTEDTPMDIKRRKYKFGSKLEEARKLSDDPDMKRVSERMSITNEAAMKKWDVFQEFLKKKNISLDSIPRVHLDSEDRPRVHF